MDAANNNQEACVVCKHLGKQCDENCILGPYFPIERTQEFKYVHKIYGIHNLTQIVSSVEENERATTIETLILEAKMRVHDMVNGSYGVEKALRTQYTNAVKELNLVKQQLRFLRGAAEEREDEQSSNGGPLSNPASSSNRWNPSDLKGKRNM